MMATHPPSITAIADSPVGLAAFFLDHDLRSYELIARSFDGVPEGRLTRDDVLDNITHFWLTNTAISAGRLYWEWKSSYFDVKNVSIPVAVSVFPDEIYYTPRSWAERAYPKLIYFNKVSKGGHFAAWEQPNLFRRDSCRPQITTQLIIFPDSDHRSHFQWSTSFCPLHSVCMFLDR